MQVTRCKETWDLRFGLKDWLLSNPSRETLLLCTTLLQPVLLSGKLHTGQSIESGMVYFIHISLACVIFLYSMTLMPKIRNIQLNGRNVHSLSCELSLMQHWYGKQGSKQQTICWEGLMQSRNYCLGKGLE